MVLICWVMSEFQTILDEFLYTHVFRNQNKLLYVNFHILYVFDQNDYT